MERETGENVFFHVFPLSCVCPAFAGSGQRPFSAYSSVFMLTGLSYYKDEYS